MCEHFKIFNNFIIKYVSLTETDLVDLNLSCRKVHYSKGELVMIANEIQNSIYFITKGIVSISYYNKNEIKVFNFQTENSIITGYAIYNQKDNFKSFFNVECLEDCVMIKIPLYLIYNGFNNIKLDERLRSLVTEINLIDLLNFVLNKDSQPILDRFDNLVKLQHNINDRIPQYLIASYLGITPVHFSNLKKNRYLQNISI